jgi:uncharacterized protein (TIGR02646 family)
LIAEGDRGSIELEAARRHYQENPNERYDVDNFVAYRNPYVKAALLRLFHGKCAYCESFVAATAPGDVEHYRPKGRVKEDRNHSGYWWLAMVWTNLLFSCIDCNRARKQISVNPGMTMADLAQLMLKIPDEKSGKEDSFPTADGNWVRSEGSIDSEKPLLLDPTVEDPREHIRCAVEAELAMVLPTITGGVADPKGVASIAVFGLNRLALVQARTALLRAMREKRDEAMRWIDEARSKRGDPAEAARCVRNALKSADALRALGSPEMPYSMLATTFISSFEEEIAPLRAKFNGGR